MYKNIFLSAFTVLLFAWGCKPNQSDAPVSKTDTIAAPVQIPQKTEQQMIDEEATEAHYTPSKSDANKKVHSERFGFSFEIPADWKAIDKSNNGDGYMLEFGVAGTDLRVYGENLEGNEVMAEMELKTCERTEKYTFGDGYPGLICYQSGDIYYYYDTPKTRVIFYIHADKKWQERNAKTIDAIAKSITAGSTAF